LLVIIQFLWENCVLFATTWLFFCFCSISHDIWLYAKSENNFLWKNGNKIKIIAIKCVRLLYYGEEILFLGYTSRRSSYVVVNFLLYGWMLLKFDRS
jgi:hypothetical protein